MGGYKHNLEEQKALLNYKSENSWFVLFGVSAIAISVIFFLYDENSSSMSYLFSFPFLDNGLYYLISGGLLILIRWWWYGFPSLIQKLLNKLPIDSELKSDMKFNQIMMGRKKELDLFFFPPVEVVDFMPKIYDMKFLSSEKVNISTLFDYCPIKKSNDKYGTSRIISYFRDNKREKLENNVVSGTKSQQKSSQKALEKYRNTYYCGSSHTTQPQEDLYEELFATIEGMLNSYDGVVIKKMPSPLSITFRKNKSNKLEVSGFSVDETISIYENNKVYFSIDMIYETSRGLSILFVDHITAFSDTKSRISEKSTHLDLNNYKTMQKVIDFFKIVITRRLLLSYGSIPSGWFVGRIESYDLRAIFSAVDRELIPIITKVNDGTNSVFGNDVFASEFLFLYWSFMKSPEIEGVIESLDWCFNAIKDVNEMEAREYAKEYQSSQGEPLFQDIEEESR